MLLLVTPLTMEKVEITNIPGKSFLLVNSQGILIDIVEKQIVSDIVCLGIYCFSDTTSVKLLNL